MIYPTREAWLQGAVMALRPWFDAACADLPDKVQVSVGFPSTHKTPMVTS